MTATSRKETGEAAKDRRSSLTTHASNPPGLLDRLQRRLVALWLLLTCVSLLVLVTLATICLIWNDIEESSVRSTEPAGRVVSVSLASGWFTRTLVETDAGFFALTDGVGLGKGEALSLQMRGNGVRFLCDSQQYCMRLKESRFKSKAYPSKNTVY